VDVEGDHQGDGAGLVPDPADDGAEHVRELRGDDQEPLLIGLRGGDMQQRDQLAGGRDGVLDQAVMRELCQLLNANAGVTENLDHRP
jgi:hypothetical protein